MILAVFLSPESSTLYSIFGSILTLNSPTFSNGLLKVISIISAAEIMVLSKGSGLVEIIAGALSGACEAFCWFWVNGLMFLLSIAANLMIINISTNITRITGNRILGLISN